MKNDDSVSFVDNVNASQSEYNHNAETKRMYIRLTINKYINNLLIQFSAEGVKIIKRKMGDYRYLKSIPVHWLIKRKQIHKKFGVWNKKSMNTFAINSLLVLNEGKWLWLVTSLEVYYSIFNITKHNKRFSLYQQAIVKILKFLKNKMNRWSQARYMKLNFM